MRVCRLCMMILVLSALWALAGCDDESPTTTCGNGVCDEGETPDSCPVDCAAGGPVCGNGAKEGSEECDGTDLGGLTCKDLGYGGGDLRCTTECTLDTAGCTDATPLCGNGTREGTEECDGTDLGGKSCEDMGYAGGLLGCTDECRFDVSGCEEKPAVGCGNGTREGTEECDGTDLGDARCSDFGYDGGVLSCSEQCTIDTSGCCEDECDQGGETRCNGTVIEECVVLQSGCLGWDVFEDCGSQGLVCDDSSGEPACAAASLPGDTCSDPAVITSFPYRVSGNDFTADFSDDADYTSSPGCTSARGAEAYFLLHLAPGTKLVAEERGELDAVWRVITDCDPAKAQCVVSEDDYLSDTMEFVPAREGTYILVLEGYAPSPTYVAYDAVIDVRTYEATCTDDQDNDGDGAIDCLDSDCFGMPGACEAEDSTVLCTDGQDNDGDGAIDCLDPDCFGMPGACDAENSEAACSDGTDNDGDGAIDCDDGDCAAFRQCQPVLGYYQRMDDYTQWTPITHRLITFTPSSSSTQLYVWSAGDATGWPVLPGSGDATSFTIAFSGSDDATAIHLSTIAGGLHSVTFYGRGYEWFSVSDNGHISFSMVSDRYSSLWSTMSALPRIAPFMMDMDMRKGGTIYVDVFSDKVAVSWVNMKPYQTGTSSAIGGTASFQAVIHADGTIQLYVDSIDFHVSFGTPLSSELDAIVGIANGGKMGQDLAEQAVFFRPSIKINEVMYSTPWDGDAGEFIELKGPSGLPLSGYALVHVDGGTGNVLWSMDLSGLAVPSDGYLVIGDATVLVGDGTVASTADVTWEEAGVPSVGTEGHLGNGAADALVLYSNWDGSSGTVVDGVAWAGGTVAGWAGEGSPAAVVEGTWCTALARMPDGRDTDDNASDFGQELFPTPGSSSMRRSPDPSVYVRLDARAQQAPDAYPVSIPDADSAGIVSTVEIPSSLDGAVVDEILVGVDIRHRYIGDLEVVLQAPDGSEVVLHDRSGGSIHDIVGVYGDDLQEDGSPGLDSLAGKVLQAGSVWLLKVRDRSSYMEGYLEDWVLFVKTR